MADEVLRIARDQSACRQIGDESVVLDLQRSVYFGLNRSAGLLWQCLLAGATSAELTGLLLADAPVGTSAQQVGADVADFLAALRREGLLHDIGA